MYHVYIWDEKREGCPWASASFSCRWPYIPTWWIGTSNPSIRSVGKPEGGQQCIFDLFWHFFRGGGGVNTNLGVERHQRGGGVKPPTPDKSYYLSFKLTWFDFFSNSSHLSRHNFSTENKILFWLPRRQPESRWVPAMTWRWSRRYWLGHRRPWREAHRLWWPTADFWKTND